MNKHDLSELILDFMTVIHRCHAQTTFTEDKKVYARDLVVAMHWIAELREGAEIEAVIEKINHPAVDKHFGEYWRQGEWGDDELNALSELRSRARE